MRRSPMPRRRSPLRSRTGLQRHTPLRNKAFGIKAKARSTGPVREVVDLVYERAGYACEIDGVIVGPVRGMDHHIHHRRPRQKGGTRRPDTNLPQNLLLLCPPCHEAVEVRGRRTAYDNGWLVGSIFDPALIQVLINFERWVYLTPDGRYVDQLEVAS